MEGIYCLFISDPWAHDKVANQHNTYDTNNMIWIKLLNVMEN